MPFRELVFDGVPHRSAAKMMPTVNCLVELQEVPALAQLSELHGIGMIKASSDLEK